MKIDDRRPVVVLGAAGLLGAALVREVGRRGLPSQGLDRAELDVARRGPTRARLRELAPAAVLNAVAYTDVGAAERAENRDEVYALNRDVPAELGRICRELGCRLVHVSTDYVFDGTCREPYREEQPVAPLQVYGQSKLEGEREVLGANADALVARTSTLYGPTSRDRPHYVDAILGQAATKRELQVVRPPVSSPTYAPDLAAAILDLLQTPASGIVHIVNDGGCSRFELARRALDLAGYDDVALAERPEPREALRRPAYSILCTARFTEWTGRPMRRWDDALRDYVRNAWPGGRAGQDPGT